MVLCKCRITKQNNTRLRRLLQGRRFLTIKRLWEVNLNIARTGIILNTEKYDECVAFYKNLFGLKVLFEEDGLTCLDYHGSYLMIETEGFAKPQGKTIKENSTGAKVTKNGMSYYPMAMAE